MHGFPACPACLPDQSNPYTHAIARVGSGSAWTTSSSLRRPAYARSDPCPIRLGRKRRLRPGRFHYPRPRAPPSAPPVALEVTGRPLSFRFPDAAARRCPPAVCSHARRPRPSNAGLPNITATGGWIMDGCVHPKSQAAAVSSLVMRRSRAYCAGWGRSGSQRRAVAQRHGMPPNGAGIPRPHGSARQFAGDRWMSRLFGSSREDTPRGATQPVTPRFCQSRPKRSDTMHVYLAFSGSKPFSPISLPYIT